MAKSIKELEVYVDPYGHEYLVERSPRKITVTDENGYCEKHYLGVKLQETWFKARGMKCKSHQMRLFEVAS